MYPQSYWVMLALELIVVELEGGQQFAMISYVI